MSAAKEETLYVSRSLIDRAWPLTGLGLALAANAVWIGLLGYWLGRFVF